MSENHQQDPVVISLGLAKIRKCRWLLWGSIIGYIPGLFLALNLGLSRGTLTWLFGGWVGLLCLTVGLACIVKCPRCRQPFHTNGPTFLPVRKCVHCGLPVNADRTGTSLEKSA